MNLPHDPFATDAGEPRRLLGISLYAAAPALADLAGQLGFDVVWMDLEHGPAGFQQAESACYAARAAGALPLVRIAEVQREYVLKALEIGARIVVAPMVDTAEQAARLVQYGKFPPLGRRGLNSRTPGNRFGLDGTEQLLALANDRTRLFAQIETRAAIEALPAICRVPGLDGVFFGPSDLSLSYGWPGQLQRPELIELVARAARSACAAGKLVGVLAPPGPLLAAAVDAGARLLIVGGDLGDLTAVWSQRLRELG
jgi:2-keto-3-deoxy-L-rhamnonate aldolase RhmA